MTHSPNIPGSNPPERLHGKWSADRVGVGNGQVFISGRPDDSHTYGRIELTESAHALASRRLIRRGQPSGVRMKEELSTIVLTT